MPDSAQISKGKLYLSNFNRNTYKVIDKTSLNINNETFEVVILQNIFTEETIFRLPEEILGAEHLKKEFNKIVETKPLKHNVN